jgi:hypothetical protein
MLTQWIRKATGLGETMQHLQLQQQALREQQQALQEQQQALQEQQQALREQQQASREQQQASREQQQLLEHQQRALDALRLELVGRLERLEHGQVAAADAASLAPHSPHLARNFLPNDHAALQHSLVLQWRASGAPVLRHADLVESGFRVFSQNEEDGMLLRLFTHLGTTERQVVEIGSNTSGSSIGVPENLSANLALHHGWHAIVVDMDKEECARMRYFFARDPSTRHFHWQREGGDNYFSPVIVQRSVAPENINEVLSGAGVRGELDLMIVDIDGGDLPVVRSLALRPRVLVVEFEKRFRDAHSVFQPLRDDFSRHWAQSGSVSLPAWEKVLGDKGYALGAVSRSGYNAFFVRADVAHGKIEAVSPAVVFDTHPVFSRMPADYWLAPDHTWSNV